jgi:prophage tail gpP-like protein
MKLTRVPLYLYGRGYTKYLIDCDKISFSAAECVSVEIAKKIYTPIDTKVSRHVGFELVANLRGWPVI